MRQFLTPVTLLITLTATPLLAASKAEINALFELMRTEEMLALMAEEGHADGLAMQDDMLGGRGGAAWAARINSIYASPRIDATFRATFDAELAEADLTPLIAYFQTPAGAKVVDYEIAGRRAISDEAVEEAAALAFADLDPDGARRALLDEFIALNSLVDLNVAGAMNANLAFYRGMGAGGGLEMDEAMMLAEIWGQEPEIRDSTTGWVNAFMALTYEPLSDAELAAYVALSRSKAGRALNRALFAGYYEVFTGISYDLGEAVARFMATEEL